MFKKVLIALLALVGTFSIVNVRNNFFLKASSVPQYQIGGSNYGRINIAPTGINGQNIGLQKGDKIILDVKNTDNTRNLGWQLLEKHINYSEYGCKNYDDITCRHNSAPLTAWLSLATIKLTNTTQFDSSITADISFWDKTANSIDEYAAKMQFSLIYESIKNANDLVPNSSLTKKIITYRDFTKINTLQGIAVNKYEYVWKGMNYQGCYELDQTNPSIFNLVFDEIKADDIIKFGSHPVSGNEIFTKKAADFTFSENYWLSQACSQGSCQTQVGWGMSNDGLVSTDVNSVYDSTNHNYAVRPAAYLDVKNIVFAISNNFNSSITTINELSLTDNYTSLYDSTKNNPDMKIRVYNSTMFAELNSIIDSKGNPISQVEQGKKMFLEIEGNSGSDVSYGDNTISALVFQGNKFKYYKPLDVTIDGVATYEFDTTGMNTGTYKIAIVNEKYNESTTAPTQSSLISDTIDIKVVSPLAISYTNTPDQGASSNNTFEYGKNVGAGNTLGIIKFTGGIPNILYKITPNGDNDDYDNFKLNKNIAGSGEAITLGINTAGLDYDVDSDSLKVGQYNFCINAISNANVTDIDTDSATKKCVSITVNKATPTISFVDPNKRIEPYLSGKSFTENVTHTNTDSGVLPTYQTNNGIVSVNADASRNALITLNTAGTTGDVTVTATLPASANFNAATATKQINVYAGMTDFKFTPSKTPILTTDTVNANYLIGQLSLQNGLANYSYSIDHDPNGNVSDNANGTSFKVDTNQTANKTMNVYTTGQLTAGSYKVTFKVIDQNNQELYLPVTITITPAGQTGFEFYDYETNATITNKTKEIEYGTSNAKVIASGGLGNGTITYKIKDGQPYDVIDLDTSNGNITGIHKTGSVIVEATKASDANYSAATIEMTVKIVDGSQSLTFNPPTSKKFVLNDPIPISASLTRTDGTTGTITYVSNDISICTIDDSDASNVKVIMKAEGECSITASNSDTYYKAVSDTKKINLYGGITGTFVQVIDPLNQGDAKAQAGSSDTIAKVTSLAGGDGTFNLVKMTVTKAGVDVTNMFDIDSTWNITPKQSLTYGDYDFSIEIEDGNQESSIITGTLAIGLETNNSFKITKDSVVITELTTDYVTAQNPKIILGTQGKKGTGAIHFTLVDSVKDANETDEAISINDTGTITVNRAMTSSDLYYVKAYIDEDKTNGYAKQETPKVRVIVNKSPQSITFDSTVPSSVKYDLNKTFDISATLDRTPGGITYSSTTPSICIVEDSTKPIAKIKDKGTCVIKAENNDQNYVYEAETTSITIYDGMTAGFTQTITPLKQGDSALDPASNTVIGKITGLAGNQGTVTYGLKVLNNLVDVSSDFKINDDGEVLPVNTIKYGTYDIEITLTDGTGSSGSIKVTGKLVVGLEENNSFNITYKGSPTVSISESYTNAITGMVVSTTGKKGNGQVHYKLSDGSHRDPNETIEAIIVNDDGTITVNRATTSDDVYEVYAYVEEDLIGGYARQETSAVPIIITDASMPNMSWLVDGVSTTEIHTDYGPNKKIQLGVDQAPAGSTIEYYLVEDGTGKNNGIDVSDVVSVDKITGKVTVLHANLTAQIGQVQIKAKISCPGYTATELTPINVQIDKAEQTNFKFAQQVYTMPYGTGSFTPTFLNGAPHDDGTTYNNKLSCTDPYDVRVNASHPDTFVYDVQESNGAGITIKARNLGNRDYKAKEATAILKVLGENENLFDVTVNPSPVITYGEAVSITPDLPESADITYEYESLDDTILVQDTTNVNTFHSKKIGTVQVKVTKKETGAVDSIVYVSIRVKPKTITVELDGTYEIKAGEAIPSFVLKDITNELVNGDSLPLPNVSVSIQNTLTPGSYPITVTYPKDDSTSNYTFTQTPCDLVIIQEEPKSQWYKVYQESDATKTQSDLTKWYKEPLIMETIHSDYDQLSGNGMSNWSSTLKLDEEGIIEHNAYFKNSISNALSSPTTITTKIDYTSPIVKSMTGSIVNEDGLWKLLNDLTFNTFFKPKTSVIFTVEDPKQTEDTEVSGVSKILYKVYLADQETSTLKPLTTDGRITSNEIRNGKAAIVLQDPGDYYVCAKAVDMAGNEGSEVCSYLKIKGKGYDSDGDGIPDLNIDLDDDGTPDLNITRKECKIKEIGVIEKCKVPYTNIDTNGDGEADTNIDLDGDGEPDLNIGKVHEWHPYIEVDLDNDGKVDFKTGAEILWELNIDSDKDRKPDINVDVNKDGIADINLDTDNDFSKPEINIDNVGDGKAHINIDDNEDGKPDRNIVIFTR